MGIKDFIQNEILLPRLKKSGVLIIYDPQRRYRELCLELAAENQRVVDASESSIESREQALATLQELGEPNAKLESLLVYVPAQRPLSSEDQQEHPFSIYGVCGETFPDGDGDEFQSLCLKAKPDHATEIRRVFAENSNRPFAVIDAIGAGTNWPNLQTLLKADSAREILLGLLVPADSHKEALKGNDGWVSEAKELFRTCLDVKLNRTPHDREIRLDNGWIIKIGRGLDFYQKPAGWFELGAGAFYTGRDWTTQGNVLRHNYIHDLGGGDAGHVNTMGVYLDDCDCGDTIFGNVFFRAGRAIMIGGGRDNPVLNNLVVDCPIGLHIDARGMTWRQWNDPQDSSWSLEEMAKRLNYTQPPWSTRYPRLAAIMNESPREPLNNPIRRNVFVDCTQRVCDFDGNVRKLLDKLEIAENLAVNTRGAASGVAKAVEYKGFVNLAGTAPEPVDLGFADPAAGNFALRPDARLRKELPAFEAIPVESIGLYQDEYRQRLPAR